MRWVLACACAILAGCGSTASAPQPERPRAEGVTWRDAERGFAVTHPSSWRRAAEPLTPHLGDPRELFAVGTYELRSGGDRCSHVPVNAVEDLGPRDALLVVFERAPPYPESGYPPRPATVELDVNTNRFCVPSETRLDAWFSFGENGRAFYVLAAVGENASDETIGQLIATYDSLELEPRS